MGGRCWWYSLLGSFSIFIVWDNICDNVTVGRIRYKRGELSIPSSLSIETKNVDQKWHGCDQVTMGQVMV